MLLKLNRTGVKVGQPGHLVFVNPDHIESILDDPAGARGGGTGGVEIQMHSGAIHTVKAPLHDFPTMTLKQWHLVEACRNSVHVNYAGPLKDVHENIVNQDKEEQQRQSRLQSGP